MMFNSISNSLIPLRRCVYDCVRTHTHTHTHTHTYTYIYIYIYIYIIIYIPGAFNEFPDFFVQAFKIVVDS